MSKARWKAVAAVAVLAVSQAGCFTTRVMSGRPALGQEQTDRQWFLLAGFVNLSGAAGRECTNGIAYAESKVGVVDMLIHLGLAAGGALIGVAACSTNDASVQSNCASTGATALTFLLGTRTVTYACAANESAAAPSWLPAPAAPAVATPAP
jgi:hypothetical protein